MKFEYKIEKKCDGCDCNKLTREVDGLDPRRPTRINYLCKRCDYSYHSIPKILEYNRKYIKETHSIFGFNLEDAENISSIELKIYTPKK